MTIVNFPSNIIRANIPTFEASQTKVLRFELSIKVLYHSAWNLIKQVLLLYKILFDASEARTLYWPLTVHTEESAISKKSSTTYESIYKGWLRQKLGENKIRGNFRKSYYYHFMIPGLSKLTSLQSAKYLDFISQSFLKVYPPTQMQDYSIYFTVDLTH